MKKIKKLFLLAALIFSFISISQTQAIEWHKADQISFAWDAPANYADATPIPDGDCNFTYDIYSKDVNGSNIVMLKTVDTEQATIVLEPGDKKYLGVAAYCTDPDGIKTGPSETAWSDVTNDCLNQTSFGVHNLKAPGKPGNLKK